MIFETLADYGKLTNDTDLLTEYVRQALSAQITKQYVKENEPLKVITISSEVESEITENVQQTEHGNYLTMNPEVQASIIRTINEEIEKNALQDNQPVLLCSPAIRMYLKQIVERALPQLVVLSYNELEPDVQVQSVGMVNGT